MTIAIPTMPARATMLGELLEILRRECTGAEFVVRTHREGDPPCVDFPALTELAVIEARPWTLFVEDDVWPAPLFGGRMLEALCELTSKVNAASFFSRLGRDVSLFEQRQRWRRQAPASFSGLLAVAVRTPVLRGLPDWAPSWYTAHPEHIHAADTLLGAWLSRQRVQMMVHVPSLVQHRLGPSTLPGRGGARQSETYRLAFGEVP